MAKKKLDSTTGPFSPWVMRAALDQVARGLSREPMYDVAEWLQWSSDPLPHLHALARDLHAGTYRTRPMPLVPFPKSKDCIRPYTTPGIRDQIAFLAMIALVGPLADRRMSSSSLGARLFRPLVPTDEGTMKTGGFTLANGPTYLEFERSYGLFRRIAQRLVSTAVRPYDGNYLEGFQDVDSEALPYLSRLAWMEAWRKDPSRVYWLRLDLKLAFPSVSRQQVHADLVELLEETFEPEEDAANLDTQYLGTQLHPWHTDSVRKTVQDVTRLLGNCLADIEYSPWDSPSPETDSTVWAETHRMPKERKEGGGRCGKSWPSDCHLAGSDANRIGLPTGLMGSAFLLNVALTKIDRGMKLLEAEMPRLAYLRYMDDILLVARDPGELIRAYDSLEKLLTDSGHEFVLNEAKMYPQGFAKDVALRRILLERHSITQGNEDLFATEIVRELSVDQEERVDALHSASADRSLDRLLLLAEMKHDDDELPVDARMSYALAGIASRPWPIVREERRLVASDELLIRVRAIAERAIEQYPWRFRSWRHGLIIAVRTDSLRGIGSKVPDGYAWFTDLARRLTGWRSPGDIKRLGLLTTEYSRWTADISSEPGVDEETDQLSKVLVQADKRPVPEELQQVRASRFLRASFHRSIILAAFRYVVQQLSKVAQGTVAAAKPGTWYAALPRLQAAELKGRYGNVELLLEALYGPDASEETGARLWGWEREALVALLLAVDQGSKIVHPPKVSPGGLSSLERMTAAELLRGAGRLGPRIAPLLDGSPGAEVVAGPAWAWAFIMVNPNLSPPVDGQTLAEIAGARRLGIWRLLERPVNVDWSLPVRTASLSGEWGRADRLEVYRQCRRLHLAYGGNLEWSKVAHIFPEVPSTSGGTNHPTLVSARDVVYSHGRDGSAEVLEALTPALAPMVAHADALLEHVGGSSDLLVSPSSLKCSLEDAAPWIKVRGQQALGATSPESAQVAPNPPRWSISPSLQDAAPHDAFLVPYLFLSKKDRKPWQSLAFGLWMRTGGEKSLDRLVECGPFAPAFWQLRAWNTETYCSLDTVLEDLFSHTPRPTTKFHKAKPVAMLNEIVPVDLFPTASGSRNLAPDVEVVIVQAKSEIDYKLVLEQAKTQGSWYVQLPEAIEVESELAQVLQEIRNRSESAQVYAKTRSSGRKGDVMATRAPDLLVLPEWYVLEAHLPSLRDFAATTGVAIATGLFPIELPMAVERHASLRRKGTKVLVNEAAIIVPERSPTMLAGGRTKTVTLRFRKPEPSIAEAALIELLNDSKAGSWSFGRGQTWPLFRHSRWGRFSVAICSDLLNTLAWSYLRGRIQHMFLMAHNRAVDLFDQFTYTRGYELYANLVLCNHAASGGSVAWTPKRAAHQAQLFHVHGRVHQVTAYVTLPAGTLHDKQRSAMRSAIDAAKRHFETSAGYAETDGWWAPPPGYSTADD